LSVSKAETGTHDTCPVLSSAEVGGWMYQGWLGGCWPGREWWRDEGGISIARRRGDSYESSRARTSGKGHQQLCFPYPASPFLPFAVGQGAWGHWDFHLTLRMHIFCISRPSLDFEDSISGLGRANWISRGELGLCLWEYWLGVVREERGQVCSVEGLGALSRGRFRRLQQC